MISEEPPLVTVCMLTLNRAWIVDLALKSLLNQDYPKDKIHFILVDGLSTDGTVEIAKSILEESGIQHKTVVKKSNIGEARNICIDEMKGEVLVFWDSDVIAPPNALRELIKVVQEWRLDIVAIKRSYANFSNVREARSFVLKLLENLKENRKEERLSPHHTSYIWLIHFAGMYLTGIKQHVIRDINFKPMPFSEDAEFCLRALKQGYKVALLSSIEVYDVKVRKMRYSDPFVHSSFRDTLRFLVTLAYLETIRGGFEGREFRSVCSLNDVVKFYVEKRHYIIKTGFLALLLLFFAGLALNNVSLYLSLPLVWTLYLIYWTTKLNIDGALRQAIRVFIIGIPLSLTVAFFLLINYLKCKHGTRRHALYLSA
jgi:glycosyltransferase involved in cell wall biosynthesis